ncbi:potassium voltage-gated channel subfamily C member 4-like isoform X3 [Symsagittifera roscoffensis]
MSGTCGFGGSGTGAGGKGGRKKDQKYVFNVGGIRHETYRNTLYSVPNTRLYSLAKKNPRDAEEYDSDSREFFFDRHPGAFEQIINFYRTGKLHCPMDICGPMFEEELRYWGIEEKLIEPCCWMNYIKHRDAEASMNLFEGNGPSSVNTTEDEEGDLELSTTAAKFGMSESSRRRTKTKWERIKPKVWRLIDDPYSSCCANIITLVSMTFIVVSIIGFCLETHHWGRVEVTPQPPLSSSTTTTTTTTPSNPVINTTSLQSAILPLNHPPLPNPYQDPFYYPDLGPPPMGGKPKKETVPKRYLTILDYVCSIWFTIEFIVRLIFCPNRVVFFKTMLNLIDLLAIVPFYVQILADKTDLVVSMWEIIKILRIFRVFKLCRHVIGLKVLVHTLRASAKELILLIVFLVLGVVIFSSLLHYAESLDPDNDGAIEQFDSIPAGFWWAIITMTTIGYGDQLPQTMYGRIVGALCAICGVLTISLPVPVIVNNFTLYYNHAQARLKLPKKRRIDKLAGAAEALKYSKHDEPNMLVMSGATRPNDESTVGDREDSDWEPQTRYKTSREARRCESPTRSDFEPMSPESRINTSISVESFRGTRRRSNRPRKPKQKPPNGSKKEKTPLADSIFITTFSDDDNCSDDMDTLRQTQEEGYDTRGKPTRNEYDSRTPRQHPGILKENKPTSYHGNSCLDVQMNGPIYPSPNQSMQKYNTNDGINKTSDYYSVAPSRSNGTACKSMLEMATLQKTNSTSTDSNIEATRHQISPSNVSNLKVQSPKLKPHGRRNSFIPRFSNFEHRKDTQDEEQFLCVDDSDPNRFDHDLDRNRDDNSRSARAGRNSGRRNGDGGGGKQSKYPEFSFRVENSDGGTSPPLENEVSTTDEACYLKSSHGQKGFKDFNRRLEVDKKESIQPN